MSEGDHGEKLFLAKIWAFASGETMKALKSTVPQFFGQFSQCSFSYLAHPRFFRANPFGKSMRTPPKKEVVVASADSSPPIPFGNSGRRTWLEFYAREGRGLTLREGGLQRNHRNLRTVQGRYYLKAILLDGPWNIRIHSMVSVA